MPQRTYGDMIGMTTEDIKAGERVQEGTGTTEDEHADN